MNEIDVEPTAEVIDKAAYFLEKYAEDLRRHSETLRKTKDLDIVALCVVDIANCFQNLRLDLLVTRPIRELRRKNDTGS